MARRGGQDRLDGIAIFVCVAQSASFTEAGRQLGLSASGVSRAIARLEGRLGARLVKRTTRQLSLTAEGRAYFESCCAVLADLEAAENALAKAGVEPRGLLRIQVPRGFGRTVIVPKLAAFLARYPDVNIDITVRDGAIDPAEEGVDASFILGEPSSRGFVARKVCMIGYGVCGAPDFLDRHGRPEHPDDLANLPCLNYLNPRSGRPRDWRLRIDGKTVSVSVQAILIANDIQAVHQAAVAGTGLAYLMDFLIADDISTGRLEIVMKDYVLTCVPVHACYARSQPQSPRLSAFIDHITEQFSDASPWSMEQLLTAHS